MAVLQITVLLLVSLACIRGVSSDKNDMSFKRCYVVGTRNECLFYPLNWKTEWRWAQKYCSDNEGRLVSIYNAKMQEAVSEFISKKTLGFVEDIWIGARRHWGEWTWLNHLPLTGIAVSNTSTAAAMHVKAAVSKQKTIVARHPVDELPYICQYKVGTTRCRDTLQYFDEDQSCYVFYSNPLSWYDARNKCLKLGGDLASIVNADTNVQLGRLATSPHWIGLRSSWWTWLDGTEVRFSRWMRGQPTDHTKMCVAISSENPGMWKTADCGEKWLRFVCQKIDKDESIMETDKACPGWCIAIIVFVVAVALLCLFAKRRAILRWRRRPLPPTPPTCDERHWLEIRTQR